MMSILLFGALLIGGQGEAVVVSVDDEPGLEQATVAWNGHTVPLQRLPCAGEGRADSPADCWVALIGIDLDTAAGTRRLPLTLRFDDASVAQRELELQIEPREFPTTRLTVAPGFVDLDPDDQARAAREAAEIAAIYSHITPTRMWSGEFAIPVQGVTGGRNFGHRRVFNDQPRSPHSGADLRASTGTPVSAANAGRVVLARPLFFSGNAVFLDHGLGVYSVYLHLSEFRVEPGEMVEKGQVLGLAGATGRVTGPHLHWGIRILEARVDPFTLTGIGVD